MQIIMPRPRDNDGREFWCSCHGGTQFVLYTKANTPYASCPVCGSVCEYRLPISLFMPAYPIEIERPAPTTVPSAGKKTTR